jgi:hypothetical protein
LPREGQVVQVWHRQYLVTEVASPDLCEDRSGQTLVSLVCLDDDAAGRRLEVLWERELGARVVEPEAHGLGKADRLDPPRHFAAYLHALKWGCVTATDARLFQSPFRAGVKLLDHQLVPLRKALELPRVNLFLADDVGLGKTIEAGLILQELMLRQRVDQALIICPAALARRRGLPETDGHRGSVLRAGTTPAFDRAASLRSSRWPGRLRGYRPAGRASSTVMHHPLIRDEVERR